MRAHTSSLLTLALLIVSLLACASSGLNSSSTGQYGFTAEEKQQQGDKKLSKKLDASRAAVQKIPGPKQYKEYTLTLCSAYNEGLFERQPELDPELTQAVELGDRIATKAPYEAHNVTAFKGLLLVCAGKVNEGEQALIKSIEIQPGRDAGEVLATLYGLSGEFELVGETCARVVPALSAQDRFMMMSTCKEQLHATSDESAFFWARPEDIDFWNSEQNRRAEADRRRAVAEEKERANILEQQREQWQAQRQQRKQLDVCLSQCKQRVYTCNKDCYNDNCTFSCNKAYEGCQEECYIRHN